MLITGKVSERALLQGGARCFVNRHIGIKGASQDSPVLADREFVRDHAGKVGHQQHLPAVIKCICHFADGMVSSASARVDVTLKCWYTKNTLSLFAQTKTKAHTNTSRVQSVATDCKGS